MFDQNRLREDIFALCEKAEQNMRVRDIVQILLEMILHILEYGINNSYY